MSTLIELGRSGPYVVAALGGDIDIANVEPIRLHILEAVPNDAHGVIVELSAVRYIDSAGVHMLFTLIRRLEAKRQGLAIAVPEGSSVATLLKITNLSEAVPVCSTVEECAETLREDAGLG